MLFPPICVPHRSRSRHSLTPPGGHLPSFPSFIHAIIYTGIGVIALIVLGYCEFGIVPALEKGSAPTVPKKVWIPNKPIGKLTARLVTVDTNAPATDTGMLMDENDEEIDLVKSVQAIKAEIANARTIEFDALWKNDPVWWNYASMIRSCHRVSFITDPKLSYDQARTRCLDISHYEQ